mgnify:CR=1 FL=1
MEKFDVAVIGAGPGGYVAAIRAAQLGFKTVCFEKEPALGGTCLRVGCIPSKALLEASEKYHEALHLFPDMGIRASGVEVDLPAMMARKDNIVKTLTGGIDMLFKKNKITRILGTAVFASSSTLKVQTQGETREISADHIIIATGSKSATLPQLEPDGNHIVTSDEAIAFGAVPKHLVVIGAGYIGLELGCVWKRLGAEVTVVEYLDRILPGMDGETAREAKKEFESQGLAFLLGSRVTSAKVRGKTVTIEIEGRDPIRCDKVLLAVGRKPNTDALGLEAAGVKTDDRGRIPVDTQFKTSVPGIYAIGDVTTGPMLAHKAMDEGEACAEIIAGKTAGVNHNLIPGVVYTSPEVATVGKSEEQLKEEGISYSKGVFPFKPNGRAKALGQTVGKVKILAAEQSGRILGVHIIGPRAGDLIAEATAAMAFGASAEDLAMVSHAHPTLAEVLKEAAMAVDGKIIHG